MIYDINYIAVKLNVDKETVRRWIRNGSLKAELHSKKEGYIIHDCDLEMFVENKKRAKYTTAINNLKCNSGANEETMTRITELLTTIAECKKELHNLIDSL